MLYGERFIIRLGNREVLVKYISEWEFNKNREKWKRLLVGEVMNEGGYLVMTVPKAKRFKTCRGHRKEYRYDDERYYPWEPNNKGW